MSIEQLRHWSKKWLTSNISSSAMLDVLEEYDALSDKLDAMTDERNKLLARVVELERKLGPYSAALKAEAQAVKRADELEARLAAANENTTCWAALGEVEGLLGISGSPPVTTAAKAIEKLKADLTAAKADAARLREKLKDLRRFVRRECPAMAHVWLFESVDPARDAQEKSRVSEQNERRSRFLKALMESKPQKR